MSEAGAIGGGGRPLRLGAALSAALRAAGPPLLFGLRVWASVCLALYVAFWLELDNAFWAGTSAAIIASDQLGATGGVNGDAFILSPRSAS
jgi:Fusaric acid resistance protein family